MICECCNSVHGGEYGSGRFCSQTCSRSFSTKSKRLEINKKVSDKLKGKLPKQLKPFKKGDKRIHKFTDEEREKAVKSTKKHYAQYVKETPFEFLTKRARKKILIDERGRKCEGCDNSEWMSNPIKLEYHHIDGDNSNNTRENSQLLCPNCHSYTPSWRNKNFTGI
jgi:hypothetical protein